MKRHPTDMVPASIVYDKRSDRFFITLNVGARLVLTGEQLEAMYTIRPNAQAS